MSPPPPPPLTDATIRDAVKVAVAAEGPAYAHPVYGPIADWDTSRVTSMHRAFSDARAFNGDLSRWDVARVSDMRHMFTRARAFNGDLSRWNTANVSNMFGMFAGATAFNGDLSRWDVSRVTNTIAMFLFATSFNGDLSGWVVRDDLATGGMFSNAAAFCEALSPTLLKRLRAQKRGFRRHGRWLWRFVRRRVRTRAIAYYWMGLAARPDAAGNAPRGAIQAFSDDGF